MTASHELTEAQVRAIVTAAVDCVITIDAAGMVRDFNPAAERVFGYTRKHAIGREMAELIIPDRFREAHRSGLRRLVTTGESRLLGQRIEVVAIRATGEELPVELTLTRLGDETPPLFTGYLRDISERRAHEQALAERTRLASLAADVGIALTHPGTLRDTLQRCAEAVVDRLDAAFARIWTLSPAEPVLELQASAGMYTHTGGAHGRVPVGQFKIGLIAQERRPHLTNDVIGDDRVGDQEWARREGMVAFAGYPLLIGQELVGVLAMFSRRPLTDADFEGLATVANGLALGIARVRTLEAVSDSEERYRFLADALPAQVWTALPDGRLDYLNQRALTYAGRNAEDMVGERWRAFVHPEDSADTVARWEAALRTGDPFEAEMRLRAATGTYRWHIGRALALKDAGQRILRWVGTFVDIQDYKEARIALQQRADELARLAAALERSNRELDQFAYVASHDLKAPLRGIANLSQWIEEDLGDAMTPPIRQQMDLLRGRVHRMEGLIEGVLQYSRAGRVRTGPERVATRRAVTEAIDLLAPPPHVAIEIASELPVLMTERLPLQQVILNLVGNAVKYTVRPDPRITISARAVGKFYEFAIADNGPGIKPEYHDRIWGIFQTLEARDKVEGTGIGLALVKKIVETKGGRAWVESAEGEGATFKFLWPATDEEPPGLR